MPPNLLISQLHKIGKMLNRWRAEFRLAMWGSILLFCLWVAALSDVLVQFERAGRGAAWIVLVGVALVMVERLCRALFHAQTPETVAVRIEETFPQLDNHLINFLQFAAAPGRDPLRDAYVKMDLPHWSGLDFTAMKNKQAHRKAQTALAVAMLLLLIPIPLIGQAWPVAMWRIVNPFSDVTPVSLTHIQSVSPGDASVLQGSTVLVSCQVDGPRGHPVLLDVKRADSDLRTYTLGTLSGRGTEGFSNVLHDVATEVRYRVRAGDAFMPEWYTLTPRPPLAFSEVDLKVMPPPHTKSAKLQVRHYDAQATSIEIPMGASVELATRCNAPLSSLFVSVGKATQPLTQNGDARKWGGGLTVTNGSALVLAAVAQNGDQAELRLAYTLLPDRAPTLEILAPKQAVVLAPSDAPSVNFKAADDYGLGEIVLQHVLDPSDKDSRVEILQTYNEGNQHPRDFTSLWKGDVRKPSEKDDLVLRLVARDNYPGTPHVTVSPLITFKMESAEDAAKRQAALEQKTFKDLNRMIEMQRDNITLTKDLQASLARTTAAQWKGAAGKQKDIRDIAKELLEKGGGRSLGNLAGSVKKLYASEMAEVIVLLDGVYGVKDETEKTIRVIKALNAEEKIFRQLTFAEIAAAQARTDLLSSALTGMLDGLIKNQGRIIKDTSLCVSQSVAVAATLTEQQDALASDVSAFIAACAREAEAAQGGDKDFASFLKSVVELCKAGRIQDDMLLAAEQLEKNSPREALPLERTALDKLLAARRKFDETKALAEKETSEELVEALQNANNKIEKIKDLEKKLIAEMDAVQEMKDKTGDKKTDKMEEDFKEMEKNIQDALLQVPKDLDIFAPLNVGNDLVEDVFSVFEEVTRNKAAEAEAAKGPVEERAVMKRDYMLEAMEKVQQRIDDVEMFLKNTADTRKVTVEAFDKEELPQGVALTPLQTEMDDLIGDLMEQKPEEAAKADDGAINSAMPDSEMGGQVVEGDTSTFSAKGKSGNSTPDHKEQDGRSNVGRQGMSDGETAAGSGTIGEGDKNIEARRTQDPTQAGQVKADGEADTKATGGGKLGSGKADSLGQGGGAMRMDSTEAGSMEGFLAMTAKRADATYAMASLKGLRSDSLKQATHHIRQAADAVSKGAPIDQVAELKRKAIAELKKAKVELGNENTGSLDGRITPATVNDIVEAGPEEAPVRYRDLVSEYYKKLNESL
jgi:hypothetical protein